MNAARNLLVVGGNGFIGKPSPDSECLLSLPDCIPSAYPGSAVCKAALARGFQVTSVR